MAETFNYQLALSLAKSSLSRSSAEDVCSRTGAVIQDRVRSTRGGSVSLFVLDRRYSIEWEGEDVAVVRDGDVLAHFDPETLVVLHYLNHADGTRLSGEWVPFRKLPAAWGGYSRSFEGRAVRPIVGRFGADIEGFCRACEGIGGEPAGLAADASYRFQFLPRLPISVLLWREDDEFPARASVLFDSSAGHYLPIEDITIAASILANRLCRQ